MTTTAYHALSLLIRENLTEINEHLQGCLTAIKENPCDLVGIAISGEMAEVFIADFPRCFWQRWNYPLGSAKTDHLGEATNIWPCKNLPMCSSIRIGSHSFSPLSHQGKSGNFGIVKGDHF